MSVIKEIIDFVKDEDFIFIQTHNFPDHDAVASAYALQELFNHFNIESHLIYEGDVQRDSLKAMIDQFDIKIKHNREHDLEEHHYIIVVDGCKGNKNVTDLIGDEIAVIDHHFVEATEDVKFVDIRSDYGACSSIIYSYFIEEHVEISENVATALMIGINMDTALLTRGVSEFDIKAYAELYEKSNVKIQNSLLRNYIQTKDLSFYKLAIDNVVINDEIAFCYFEQGCNQNLLGILGDFFLALEEVDFVILCANNDGNINFSLRSEKEEWNASLVIQNVLNGIGFGGGHGDMAGGIIKDLSLFNEKDIFDKFISILNG